MSENKELAKFWFDDQPKNTIKNRCGYCGKELPQVNMRWCNSIHRAKDQVCGRRGDNK